MNEAGARNSGSPSVNLGLDQRKGLLGLTPGVGLEECNVGSDLSSRLDFPHLPEVANKSIDERAHLQKGADILYSPPNNPSNLIANQFKKPLRSCSDFSESMNTSPDSQEIIKGLSLNHLPAGSLRVLRLL